MKLNEININEYRGAVNYICALCGYPTVTDDKLRVSFDFLKEQHRHNSLDDLTQAFNMLASGRLDEKLDSIKSFTGLTVSRVLQSYARSRKNPVESPGRKDGEDRSYVSDNDRAVILDKFNKTVLYSDELTDSDKDYLMSYWVDQNKNNYKNTKSISCCTSTAYDYLENKGIIRVHDGQLQHFTNNKYVNICPIEVIERAAHALKFNEDVAITKSKNGNSISAMRNPFVGVSLDACIKRISVSEYFQAVIT